MDSINQDNETEFGDDRPMCETGPLNLIYLSGDRLVLPYCGPPLTHLAKILLAFGEYRRQNLQMSIDHDQAA